MMVLHYQVCIGMIRLVKYLTVQVKDQTKFYSLIFNDLQLPFKTITVTLYTQRVSNSISIELENINNNLYWPGPQLLNILVYLYAYLCKPSDKSFKPLEQILYWYKKPLSMILCCLLVANIHQYTLQS